MKIKTKYDIGQKLWFFTNGNLVCAPVSRILIHKNFQGDIRIRYNFIMSVNPLRVDTVYENLCYESRDEIEKIINNKDEY